jgi:hypothetical protein
VETGVANHTVALKDALPLIGVLLGGILSIAGGLLSNLFIECRRAKSARRNLALAFAGEISAIVEIVNTRQYIPNLRNAITYMEETGEIYPLHISVNRDYFNVYVSNIGILGGRLPRMIATFYTQGNSVLEDINSLSNDALGESDVSFHIEAYKELLKLFESTIVVGHKIVCEIEKTYS